MDDKAIRRRTRELADQAYEEKLRRVLVPLAEAFERWKIGAATSVEISDLIHEPHEGPSKRLRGASARPGHPRQRPCCSRER